jgi:Ser-tRNA(Ala) deacylase AlaX
MLTLSQRQPYLRTVEASVLSCKPGVLDAAALVPAGAGDKDKKKGKGKAKAQPCFEVELGDTVLYPVGGGQPSDTGHLLVGGELVPILYAYRNAEGKVMHQIATALPEAAEVTVNLDWNYRYDHMQQHSAQHLISAVALEHFSAKTISWWLAGGSEASQIELDKELSEEEVRLLASKVNDVIRSCVALQVHVFNSNEEALEHPLFRAGKRAVPDNMAGPMRVVEIPGVDFNACGGTHLANTGEMQLVFFPKVDRVKGNFRLHFVAGMCLRFHTL